MLESVLEARRRAAMEVHFFDIAFQPSGTSDRSVVAADSRGRQLSANWSPPFEDEELDALIDGGLSWQLETEVPRESWHAEAPSPQRDLSAPPPPEDGAAPNAEDVGRQLFQSLFNGEVGRLYREDVGLRGKSLCIVLTFDPSDVDHLRLFALPWECLHGGRDFLGLAGRPIVRRLRSRGGDVPEPLLTRRLRILAVPLDGTGLDLEAEAQSLTSMQKRSRAFDLKICPRGQSLIEVRQRLEDGRFHVLHLMGHGSWSHAQNAWGVEFAGRFVTAAELARQLRSELSDVRLVVINTCHGGRTLDPETAEATRGLAAVLVDEGALAVIANGAPITDAAARLLTMGLYDRVGRGWSLPQALASTRLDLQGQAAVSTKVHAGEWVTPRLHLRSSGRVFIVKPRRWSLPSLTAFAAGLAGSSGLVATAGVWLAQPLELALVSLPLALLLGCVVWGWLRHSFPEIHPLTGLVDFLASNPGRGLVSAGLLLVVGLGVWGFCGARRLEELPCLRQGPEVDWSRSVLVDFTSEDPVDSWGRQWQDDLRSTLTEKRLVPLTSELGQSLPRTCFSWVLEGRSARTKGSKSFTSVRVIRHGREVVDHLREPGSPSDLQDLILRRLGEALEGRSTKVLAGLSPGSRESNAKALDLYRKGDFGRAANHLEEAVEQDPDAALLRGNLAQILLDMARTEHLQSRKSNAGWSELSEQALLAKALRHLDMAIHQEPGSALHRFHRGRVRHQLADRFGDSAERAEADYRAALELRPLFPEAANDLAVLLLDQGGDIAEASELLEGALLVVDAADRSTKAALLKNLGRARHVMGDLDGAWGAFEQAECLAPRSRRGLRAEALGRTALLHQELLGPASADVAWWRYSQFLMVDDDLARRQAFFGWRRSIADRPGRDRFELWSLRCDRGQFNQLSS